MSKEIRQMIDKVKNFKEFVNENVKTIDDFYAENNIDPEVPNFQAESEGLEIVPVINKYYYQIHL